jgi:hypothetical protein
VSPIDPPAVRPPLNPGSRLPRLMRRVVPLLVLLAISCRDGTVTQPAASCAGVTPLTLAAGEARVLAGGERNSLCIAGGAAGSEYVLVPMNLSTERKSSSVRLLPDNTSPVSTGAASAALSDEAIRGFAGLALTDRGAVGGRMPRDLGFERRLRSTARQAMRRMRSGAQPASRSVALAKRSAAAIRDLPSAPSLGTLVNLNASSTSFCDTALTRTGRVRAISSAAIVVEDTTAPPGGFTDAEYLSIATTFDTLLYPLDTTAFGAPFDMDGNGRVLLFFTTAVNQRTASNATSVIGGYFWERDLIPRVANAVVPFSCATSNEGEMFYLPVVDVASRYNGFFTSKAALLAEIDASTVHEFQHLINSSVRFYITPEIVLEEEPWLNEAMSHVAEELLYFRVAGLQPRADINFTTSATPAARFTALTNYQVDNLARFNTYLRRPDSSSAFADNDDLETRGAGWALLRWALDHSPGAQETYLRALVRAPTQGFPNFNGVFSAAGGFAGAMRGATVAHFTDNFVSGISQQFSHQSWNFRDWLPHFVTNNNAYPLRTKTFASGVQLQVPLVAGGSAFVRFRVASGTTAGVGISISGDAPASAVDFVLVRVQ